MVALANVSKVTLLGIWLKMIKTCLSSRCSFGVSEAYLEKIANSEWSYVALATACYKLASPARYTVTVGGSTLAIKYLKVRNCCFGYFFPRFTVDSVSSDKMGKNDIEP